MDRPVNEADGFTIVRGGCPFEIEPRRQVTSASTPYLEEIVEVVPSAPSYSTSAVKKLTHINAIDKNALRHSRCLRI